MDLVIYICTYGISSWSPGLNSNRVVWAVVSLLGLAGDMHWPWRGEDALCLPA